jgi:hypothetical protein
VIIEFDLEAEAPELDLEAAESPELDLEAEAPAFQLEAS